MGTTVDSILQLQRDYRTLASEWRSVTKTYSSLDAQYGGSRDQRHARLEEIKRQLSETLHWKTGEHGEFDARHNLQASGGTRTWTTVQGCSDCDRKQEESGRSALRRERTQTYEWIRELNGYIPRMNELHESMGSIVEEMNRQAERLGLPSFDGQLTIDSDFITSTTVSSFSARGQYLLDSGISINYGVTTVVLDNSEQVVAYRSGGGDWTITSVGTGYWEKYKSSLDRDTGLAQTDFFAGTVGERDQKKKVHIAVDENGDVIFVRDIDGEVLYDRKHGIGHLPSDLSWDR